MRPWNTQGNKMVRQCHIQNSTKVLEIANAYRKMTFYPPPLCVSPPCLALTDKSPVEFTGRAGQEGVEGMKAQEPEQKRPVSHRSQDAMGPLTTVGSWEVRLPRQRTARKHLLQQAAAEAVTGACPSVGRDLTDQWSWVPSHLWARGWATPASALRP